MIWGHGQPDGTDKMVMEKGSRNFYMRYSSQRGTTGVEMNYSGSVSLTSEYTLSLHSRNSIEADNNIYAPDFIKSSTVKIKDNIKKFDGDALGIVMDTDVFTYYFKRDLERGIYDNQQIGFMAETSPMLKRGDGVSVDRIAAINWAATQQQQDEVKALEKRIDDIETILEAMV